MNFLLLLDTADNNDRFCDLYSKYNKILYRRVYNILHNSQDTEDALQTSWEKVFNNFNKIENKSENKSENECIGFIWIVTKNTAIDIYNKRKRIIPTESDNIIFSEKISSVEEDVIGDIRYDELKHMILSLDYKYKIPFILKYLYNCSYKEIAELLNISESNVSTRINRAKMKIKEVILKKGD